jgi:hypothetical protein
VVLVFDRAQDRSRGLWDKAFEDRVVGDLVAADHREQLVGQAGDQLREVVARGGRVGVGVDSLDLLGSQADGVAADLQVVDVVLQAEAQDAVTQQRSPLLVGEVFEVLADEDQPQRVVARSRASSAWRWR